MANKFPKQTAEIEGICQRMGITPDELRSRAAIKETTFYKWFKGYQKASDIGMQQLHHIEEIAKLHGTPTKVVDHGVKLHEVGNARLIRNADKMRRVPVVSWARAGAAGNYSDLAEMIDEWIETTCPDPNAFALIIEGDSMEPRFEAGDRVIFAPNSEPRNGDYVVARRRDDGGVFFKRFKRSGPEGKVVLLESLNQNYKTIEAPLTAYRFIYPAVDMKRFFPR